MMKKIIASAAIALTAFTSVNAAEKVVVTLQPDSAAPLINKEIYGQFAEHLGTCIYGGLWVGTESSVPNTDGYRNDMLAALRELHVPVLRWPGGCFADEYHWTDGIGPRKDRPRMVNNNWGGTVEDNSFGTHEFFNLCEMLGIEPYLSGNVGSGTVEELAKWVEYITAEDGPQAKIRKQNGREKPWRLKYLGVGNESWGCGGSFTPEHYANEYRRYQTYCRNFNGNKLYKIASGASDYDYNWTDVLMRNAKNQMDGISLHYYTVAGWSGSKGSATKFSDDDYYWTLGKCLEIGDVVRRHMDIMDKYDPKKRVGLLVDEWGTWWDEEPGTVAGHLYQQNTMRDAMVAALSLNTFHGLTDRVKMTNIAQIANVLQSMILTNDSALVLTPTYFVYKMYVPHQDARYIPLNVDTRMRQVRDNREVPQVSVTASEKDGKVTISLTNTDLKEGAEVEVPLADIAPALGFKNLKKLPVAGEILTSADIHDYNDFDHPTTVELKPFKDARIDKSTLKIKLPAKSIVTLTLG